MTRIIAGRARGRRLAVPVHGTRPTSDRVREAMFSTVDSVLRADGIDWSEVAVLDLFAGSGALGLEALSRGARSVVLAEQSRPAARVLAANVEAVGGGGAEVVVRDVRLLAMSPPPVPPAALVFADPPYDWPAPGLRVVLEELAATGWIAPDALVVVERPARDPDCPLPGHWSEPQRRPYGDTVLWYGRVPSPDAVEADEEAR